MKYYLLLLSLLSFNVSASDLYDITVERIIDGDTVDVTIDLGFNVQLTKQRVRMYNIDTPESRTKDLVEKKYGLMSKEKLKELLSTEGVKLEVHGKGKFGRILGDFILPDGSSVVDIMVDQCYGVRYLGENKKLVEQKHLDNRTCLKDKR